MVWPGGSGILSLSVIAAPNQCHDSVMQVVQTRNVRRRRGRLLEDSWHHDGLGPWAPLRDVTQPGCQWQNRSCRWLTRAGCRVAPGRPSPGAKDRGSSRSRQTMMIRLVIADLNRLY